VAGEGPPLVLLHGLGDDALDWSWTMPALSRRHRVYAPYLYGFVPGEREAGYPSSFYADFLASFMDALGVEKAAVVGSSFGGLIALRLALSGRDLVQGLVLVSSAGLGRAVNPALASATMPGYGDAAIALGKTHAGAWQRAWGRAALLFARPGLAPPEWLREQHRLARTPGFLEDNLGALRAGLDPLGQREVLLEELTRIGAPTLVVWGAEDRVFPAVHAREAVARLGDGRLELVGGCGHLPHVERPERFLEVVCGFLRELQQPTQAHKEKQ
jgi:pimeloyl-ACP methyl ester carboxylesterase